MASSDSPTPISDLDAWHMRRALQLASQGRGHVEPNPMVGCLIVQGAEIIGEGWHRRFGGPHAEIHALAVAGARAAGSTLYVTLEPCCHFGKTPPCTQAVIAAGVRRVVFADRDPFPEVAGKGAAELRAAGIEVTSGILADEARRLNAPYHKLLAAAQPWVIAKWAMTLDGRIATITGNSRWVSGEASRRVAHELRGRVDSILIGRQTAAVDDPLLTARPPGPRIAARIVLDSQAALSPGSQLARTVRDAPLIVAASATAASEACRRLEHCGCEVLILPGDTHAARLAALLVELGRRRMTNLLVEGGSQLLGSLLDADQIDEVHVFIAPKLIGGATAPGPIAGMGRELLSQAMRLEHVEWTRIEDDLYLHGLVHRE